MTGKHYSKVIIKHGTETPLPFDSLFNCIISICAVAIWLLPALPGEIEHERETGDAGPPLIKMQISASLLEY